MKDLVSIIIPVYKAEKYLDQCVESLINQTYSNIEIVLVDDGSPDNCPKICDKWTKKDKRIKVIHKKNAGTSKAVIDGINFCSGKYLLFVDSDDYVKNDYVEKLYSCLIENNADIAICNYTKVYESQPSRDINEIIAPKNYEKGVDLKNCAMLYMGHEGLYLSPCRWNKIFRKSIVLDSFKYLNPEISMGEDVNLTFYAMSVANKVSVLPDKLLFYRQLPNSISNTKRNNWIKHYNKLTKQLILINKELNLELEKEIYNSFVLSFINESMKYAVDNYTNKELKEFLSDEFLQECISKIPKNNLKRKIYYWALAKKYTPLIRLALKIMKV